MTPPDTTSALADPGKRLLAALIDAGTPFAAMALFGAVGIAIGSSTLLDVGFAAAPLLALVLFVANLVWLARDGQTLGKKALGLRILRTNGERAGLARLFFLRALAPALLAIVPWVGTLFWVANALAIFGPARRCLHDFVADTIVVTVAA